MKESVRVALVNDYEIVLEGLRSFLRRYAPGIRVVELDVNATPDRPVDVTLFDTYGEAEALRGRVRVRVWGQRQTAPSSSSASQTTPRSRRASCAPALVGSSPRQARRASSSMASGQRHARRAGDVTQAFAAGCGHSRPRAQPVGRSNSRNERASYWRSYPLA